MDQWLPNLSESSGLHRHRSIECSSLLVPKKPSRTKNATESDFRYGEWIRYVAKRYGEGSGNACFFFLGKSGRKMVETVKTSTVVAKYRLRCRSIFSTEGCFGYFGCWHSEEETPSKKIRSKPKCSSEQIFLNRFCWGP